MGSFCPTKQKVSIMNEAQKYLIENNIGDAVLNAKQFPENTPDNAKKWIYLSDVMERFLESQKGQELPIDSVSIFVCPDCKGGNMQESNKREVWCNDCEKNFRENEC